MAMQRRVAYVAVDIMEAQYTSIVRAYEWQLAHTPMPSMTRGEVWCFICPGVTMQVVHIDGYLLGDNVLVSQPQNVTHQLPCTLNRSGLLDTLRESEAQSAVGPR